jgi:hypothetical protein
MHSASALAAVCSNTRSACCGEINVALAATVVWMCVIPVPAMARP